MLERPPADPPKPPVDPAKLRRRARRNAYERRVRRSEWKLYFLMTPKMRQRLVELRQITESEAEDRDTVARAVNELLTEALK
jgi:hypothetical protein